MYQIKFYASRPSTVLEVHNAEFSKRYMIFVRAPDFARLWGDFEKFQRFCKVVVASKPPKPFTCTKNKTTDRNEVRKLPMSSEISSE